MCTDTHVAQIKLKAIPPVCRCLALFDLRGAARRTEEIGRVERGGLFPFNVP